MPDNTTETSNAEKPDLIEKNFTPLSFEDAVQSKATANAVENIACFRKEHYSGQVKPFNRSEGPSQINVSVPSDYEILAIDFDTSFPASLSIQKYGDKKWVWTFI